jgi:valyl-tRNA synthetase
VVRGETVALPLAGVVDLAAERVRLDKEIAREQFEIAKVEAKLGNRDFVSRAPEDIIAEHEDRLETFQARLVKLNAARERVERI